MRPDRLEADYVIVGAGAVGLAFADTLLAESDATMILIDRRDAPGGHWRDAYPFLRLHSAAMAYGVNAMPLGEARIEESGLNRGHYELAGAAEICAYYEALMRERLLPSGRVSFLPLHDYEGEGRARSRLTGETVTVRFRRKLVDATFADTQTPATHPPGFAVLPNVRCLAPGDLVKLSRPPAGFALLGAGKTALDTALWLLGRGVAPEQILWVRPRDPWLLNRRFTEPSDATFEATFSALAAEFEAAAEAASIEDLFARLEAADILRRLDRAVAPTMFRCAIVSDAELLALRRIERVVRLGRVRALHPERIELDGGDVPAGPDWVHVNCTADGLGRRSPEPIFQQDRIVLQYIRRCSPVLSGAFLAVLEARIDSDTEKAALATPVPPPREPLDWLRMHRIDAQNREAWSRRPALRAWLEASRLDRYAMTAARAAARREPEQMALLERYRRAIPCGLAGVERLLATA